MAYPDGLMVFAAAGAGLGVVGLVLALWTRQRHGPVAPRVDAAYADRFGPNGAVMNEMTEEMGAEYGRTSRLDFALSDAIPAFVGAAAAPILVTTDLAPGIGAPLGAALVAVALLFAVIEARRLKAMWPDDRAKRQQHQRWFRGDVRTRLMHLLLAVLLPLGLAGLL